eukprot:scaffold23485_cov20-Prasinocladus_malaysianus.AAC.1
MLTVTRQILFLKLSLYHSFGRCHVDFPPDFRFCFSNNRSQAACRAMTGAQHDGNVNVASTWLRLEVAIAL